MASAQQLKRRINSVKNTKQITRAMQLVAASKMRKATEAAHKSRDYRIYAHRMLARLNMVTDVKEHPLYRRREVSSRLYVVVSSNRGLAGAYNSNIIKALASTLRRDKANGVKSSIIMIGKRGAQFVNRIEDVNLLAVYDEFSDRPTASDIKPILHTIMEKYSDESVDEVSIIYTEHRSNIVQVVDKIGLLPAQFESAADSDNESDGPTKVNYKYSGDVFTFEPSVDEVLESVTSRLLEVQIWQALLESIASEQSMRMMSMKNATDNATDIIDDLTLEFNTARQSKITQELAEITGGVEAMNS